MHAAAALIQHAPALGGAAGVHRLSPVRGACWRKGGEVIGWTRLSRLTTNCALKERGQAMLLPKSAQLSVLSTNADIETPARFARVDRARRARRLISPSPRKRAVRYSIDNPKPIARRRTLVRHLPPAALEAMAHFSLSRSAIAFWRPPQRLRPAKTQTYSPYAENAKRRHADVLTMPATNDKREADGALLHVLRPGPPFPIYLRRIYRRPWGRARHACSKFSPGSEGYAAHRRLQHGDMSRRISPIVTDLVDGRSSGLSTPRPLRPPRPKTCPRATALTPRSAPFRHSSGHRNSDSGAPVRLSSRPSDGPQNRRA